MIELADKKYLICIARGQLLDDIDIVSDTDLEERIIGFLPSDLQGVISEDFVFFHLREIAFLISPLKSSFLDVERINEDDWMRYFWCFNYVNSLIVERIFRRLMSLDIDVKKLRDAVDRELSEPR